MSKITNLRNVTKKFIDLEKLDYFKPDKGTKAFSYFSIVGKNYLILYNNNNYKKKKQTFADAVLTAQLARILRKGDYDFKTQEVTLWTP